MSGPAQGEQRVAIVTGGGSGIGLAISERLAVDGLRVAVFDRDGDAPPPTQSAPAEAGRSASRST
jgi:2-hydroxycyclohexanecarboxyl-CoA dehydrogenase